MENKKDEERNRTWELNNRNITEAYFKLLEQNKKEPTYAEIKEETGLSVPTIVKHLKDLNLEEISQKLKLRIQRILYKLADNADKGDVKSAKLFLDAVGKLGQKVEVDVKVETVPVLKVTLFNDEVNAVENSNTEVETEDND